jgi:hypothetical protein
MFLEQRNWKKKKKQQQQKLQLIWTYENMVKNSKVPNYQTIKVFK